MVFTVAQNAVLFEQRIQQVVNTYRELLTSKDRLKRYVHTFTDQAPIQKLKDSSAQMKRDIGDISGLAKKTKVDDKHFSFWYGSDEKHVWKTTFDELCFELYMNHPLANINIFYFVQGENITSEELKMLRKQGEYVYILRLIDILEKMSSVEEKFNQLCAGNTQNLYGNVMETAVTIPELKSLQNPGEAVKFIKMYFSEMCTAASLNNYVKMLLQLNQEIKQLGNNKKIQTTVLNQIVTCIANGHELPLKGDPIVWKNLAHMLAELVKVGLIDEREALATIIPPAEASKEFYHEFLLRKDGAHERVQSKSSIGCFVLAFYYDLHATYLVNTKGKYDPASESCKILDEIKGLNAVAQTYVASDEGDGSVDLIMNDLACFSEVRGIVARINSKAAEFNGKCQRLMKALESVMPTHEIANERVGVDSLPLEPLPSSNISDPKHLDQTPEASIRPVVGDELVRTKTISPGNSPRFFNNNNSAGNSTNSGQLGLELVVMPKNPAH